MTVRYRPLVQQDNLRPPEAVALHGGPLWFASVEVLERGAPGHLIPAEKAPHDVLTRLSTAHLPISGLDLTQPHVMGILNVTPDSFSDGGRHVKPQVAVQAALAMVAAGATIIDIGGESTRPGSETVPDEEEIARTAPVIAAIRAHCDVPISIDTRKLAVARAAVEAGATLINDVSGFEYDPELAPYCVEHGLPVCIMHAQGDPATMQMAPRYDDVLLDVYDFLEAAVHRLEDAGMPRGAMLVDPGIGFGKSKDHNLTILRNLSLFHGLGCGVLLGVSRKKFIGTIGEEPVADRRVAGSIAVGLAGLAQGVQILRVHDVPETVQAVRLWNAVR